MKTRKVVTRLWGNGQIELTAWKDGQCENVKHHGRGWARQTWQRCNSNASTTIWRLEDRDGKLVVVTEAVCKSCAKMRTVGSQRDNTNPWKVR